MKYSPASAAKGLAAQGKATTPHGGGGMPPKPMDSVGKGGGMSANPKRAVECLDAWDKHPPMRRGKMY
jgi:hypothetical protein